MKNLNITIIHLVISLLTIFTSCTAFILNIAYVKLLVILLSVALAASHSYVLYLKSVNAKTTLDLKQKSEWLTVTLASISDGVIASDTEGKISLLNHSAQKYLGIDESDVVGKPIHEVFNITNGQTGNPSKIPVDKIITQGLTLDRLNNSILTSNDGTQYYISFSAAPIRNDENKILGAVVTFQDITERKRLDELQSIIYRIVEATCEATNLDTFFKYIHRALSSVINTNNFFISLYDESENTLSFPYHVDENFPERGYKATEPRKVRKGLTEYVIRTGKSILIDDKDIEELTARNEVEVIGPLPIVWLGVPLKIDKKTIGVIAVQSYDRSTVYTHDDLEFLEFISNQIAVAIERVRAEEKINHMAYYDDLTDLPNRVMFNNSLDSALVQAQSRSEPLAVLFLDLDRFKNINDSLSHPIGDQLLQEVGKRLSGCLGENELIARLGGDEFIILMSRIKSRADAAELSEKLLESIRKPFFIDLFEFNITTSIGISIYPNDAEDAQSLIKNADAALYQAKGSGKNNYQFYSSSMSSTAMKQLSLENYLRHAVEKNELVIHYQPQIDIKTGQLVGMEALLRWNHPYLGMLYPADFIPLAEETGLILSLGEWVIENACRQTKLWNDLGYVSLKVGVNISSQQFNDEGLINSIEAILKKTGLEPQYLELELTESIIMQNTDYALHILDNLKELGVLIALDDFGTGYSSLGYLKHFSIDTLKIDKSFIHDVNTDTNNEMITTAVISLAQGMNRKVIAEGVETIEEFNFLKQQNCNAIQGYLVSRPITAEQFEELLKQKTTFDF